LHQSAIGRAGIGFRADDFSSIEYLAKHDFPVLDRHQRQKNPFSDRLSAEPVEQFDFSFHDIHDDNIRWHSDGKGTGFVFQAKDAAGRWLSAREPQQSGAQAGMNEVSSTQP
jgi:hypothetical protein